MLLSVLLNHPCHSLRSLLLLTWCGASVPKSGRITREPDAVKGNRLSSRERVSGIVRNDSALRLTNIRITDTRLTLFPIPPQASIHLRFFFLPGRFFLTPLFFGSRFDFKGTLYTGFALPDHQRVIACG